MWDYVLQKKIFLVGKYDSYKTRIMLKWLSEHEEEEKRGGEKGRRKKGGEKKGGEKDSSPGIEPRTFRKTLTVDCPPNLDCMNIPTFIG